MASKKNPRSNEKIEIIGNGKYPLVPLNAVEIVERPAEGEETTQIFFNPRGLSSFTSERMEQLQFSIRCDGLQQPPIVRAITKDGEIVTKLELIAGERRIRSCQSIYEDDLPCFDENAPQPESYSSGDTILCRGRFGIVHEQIDDIVVVDFEDDLIGNEERRECSFGDCFPTISGKELYEKIPCKLVYDCSDERALRLAFTENDQSEPLTISEEVALVERLERTGLKLEEIAELLGSNVTWVSQTSNFKSQLPKKAFKKLLEGEMTRHVAVSLMSYAPELRDSLFEASMAAEAEETAEKIAVHSREKNRHEDDEELLKAEAKEAEDSGDSRLAAKAQRKAAAAAAKAEKASEKLERAKKEKGTIKQGHVKKGSSSAGLKPKKAKALDKHDIESIFVEGITPYLDGEITDEETGETIPADYAGIVRRTALAIISGITDPLHPIRDYMFDMEIWERTNENPESDSEDAGEEDAGEEDAGEEDAGEEDAGEEDAGEEDAGEEDAGEEDAGEEDAGEEDAGEEDVAVSKPKRGRKKKEESFCDSESDLDLDDDDLDQNTMDDDEFQRRYGDI